MSECKQENCPKNQILKDLLEILECNVCLDNSSCSNYMLQCQANGHSVCKRCFDKLDQRVCPVCRKITSFIPNLIVNKIFELIEKPAQIIVPLSSTKYCCPFFWDCPFSGSLTKCGLIWHLADDHLFRNCQIEVQQTFVKATIELSLRFVWDLEFYSEFEKKDFGAHFLFCCSISEDKRSWKFWCYLLSEKEEDVKTDNFVLDISVLDYRRRDIFKLASAKFDSIFLNNVDCQNQSFVDFLPDLIISRKIFLEIYMYKNN